MIAIIIEEPLRALSGPICHKDTNSLTLLVQAASKNVNLLHSSARPDSSSEGSCSPCYVVCKLKDVKGFAVCFMSGCFVLELQQ